MSEVEQLMRQLETATGFAKIDLRFAQGLWCVMVPSGEEMECVMGSVQKTAGAALSAALQRWTQQTPDEPFLLPHQLRAKEAG